MTTPLPICPCCGDCVMVCMGKPAWQLNPFVQLPTFWHCFERGAWI